ncbi:patatin-like phospholipase family protein [Kordiimonas marina]|uniref:patatin-like phospholipase family protein n=1 Tax=Kordiimonas marina TaxID=2872312 RepID=UPI001FF3F897|nr:patatin-like phospholipase family protein [Kordiimonas marina]
MAVESGQIENLVFEGGGVRGIAYAGAVTALEAHGLLSGVKRVAGTSAGAFMALLLSLGYTPEEARVALRSLHFETLEDKPNPVRIATHYGLYKGEVLYDWIAQQLTRKGLPADLTFEALAHHGGRDLRVFATDLNICNTREFSAEKTPGAPVVGAVRASMSIPLMYAAWQFPNGIPDDHIYVDGGTVYNYPINAFDGDDGVNDRTLGFSFISHEGARAPSNLGTGELFDFSRSLFAAIMRAQVIDFDLNPAVIRRTVRIDDLGYKATDLSLSPEGFNQLFSSGHEATLRYLGNGQGAA